MKKKFIYLIISILIAIALFYIITTLYKMIPSTHPITPPDVATVPIKMYGIVEPEGRAVFINPPLEKRVDAILVNVRDKVKKGQPVLILDQAEEKVRVESLKAEMEAKKAELALSEDEYKRNVPLFERQVINEFDFIRSKLDVDLKKAELEVAEKNLNEAIVRLEQLTLKSPVDGKVYRMDVRLGESFRPGDRTFIVGKDSLWVNLRIDSFWINRVQKGTYKIYHADTNEYLGKGELIRKGLYMGKPNFYIEDSSIMADLKYMDAFCTFEPIQDNIPIELVIYAEKDEGK